MKAIDLVEPRAKPTRFSMGDLFWMTSAFAAAFLFVIGWFPQLRYNQLEIASIVFFCVACLIVISLTFLFLRTQKSWLRVVYLVVFFLLTTGLGFFSWHTMVWLAIGVIFLALKRITLSTTLRLQLITSWLFISALLGNLLVSIYPPRLLRVLLEAREAYPIQDLSSRIPKPKLSNRSTTRKIKTSSEALSSDVGSWNQKYEQNGKSLPPRITRLKTIHDKAYEDFVRSLGFGEPRMSYIAKTGIDLPSIVSISFDGSGYQKNASERHLNGSDSRQFRSAPQSFPELLQRSYLDFLNPATFGWQAAPKMVAGFEPHAFRFPIPQVSIKSQTYAVRRLELIGLLMSDDPRVYVMDHLPRMDQIAESEVPTRPLNEFEASALKKLLAGEDLVVHEQPNQIKMVGALRSFESCGSCHDSKTGDLMGAFSYELEAKK